MNVFNPLDKKERGATSDDLFDTIDVIAERYGWTVNEILDLPIPAFLALKEAVVRNEARKAKAYKRKK